MLDLTGEQRAMLEAEGYKPSNYMGGYSYWYWCNVKDTARDVANMNLRKAIRAGVPVLVSKSMPTVQSAELAAEYGLQLVCGRKIPKV